MIATLPNRAALEASAHKAVRLMKLLASEQRLIILCRLSDGECSVGELAGYLGMNQAATSQHLGKMRAEGLVVPRRSAQTIYYRIDDQAALKVVDLLCTLYGGDTALETQQGRAQNR